MSNQSQQPISRRTLENATIFGLTYTFGTAGEAIVDAIHNPGVMDVPQPAVVALGFLIASATTVIADLIYHRPGSIE